jgi:Fe-S oxidoreductase
VVLLWPDTFTNSFHPHIGQAAVELLEDAGWTVRIPTDPVCCGLTWISTGQLDTAKKVLRRTVDQLADHVRAGGLVLGLEPSCTTVFRSDAPDLLPDDLDIERLRKQTVTLAELLTEHTSGWTPPSLAGVSAMTQVHCHQHAVLGWDADQKLLEGAGASVERLDSGCCGLAGNFGFEAGHLQVSSDCAESVLLPALRSADPDAVVLADGFSCRTQIHELDSGDREAVHLAELLDRARRGESRPHATDLDDGDRPREPGRIARAAALGGSAVAALAVAAGAAITLRRIWRRVVN